MIASWLAAASPWQLLAATHLALTVAVYLVSFVLALLRRWGSAGVTVTADDLAISALKPLRGLDPHLEENLESFARLDAPPAFEVLLLVDDARDEALAVAERLAKKYPARFRVVVGTKSALANPKMASLSYAVPLAKNPLLWVTDSNVETSDAHLRAQVAEWKAAQRRGRVPTLVHAPVAAVGGSGLGARLERVHLGAYIGISAETTRLACIDTVVGKSLLFHREDLAKVGGFEAFGAAGGEDFLMGRAFRRAGSVRLARRTTCQVLGERLLAADFWKRQARWAKVRQSTTPLASLLLEPFSYFGTALLWLALGLLPWEVVVGVMVLKVLGDATATWAAVGGVSILDLLLVPFKEAMLLVIWASAPFSREVTWRGRRLAISGGDYRAEGSEADPAEKVPTSVS